VTRIGNVLKFVPVWAGAAAVGARVDDTRQDTALIQWQVQGVTVKAPQSLAQNIQIRAISRNEAMEEMSSSSSPLSFPRPDQDAVSPLLSAGVKACVLLGVREGDCLEIRHPRNGDRFLPSWRASSPVKLTAFFRSIMIPLHLRDSVWVVSSAYSGRLVAVPPYSAHCDDDLLQQQPGPPSVDFILTIQPPP